MCCKPPASACSELAQQAPQATAAATACPQPPLVPHASWPQEASTSFDIGPVLLPCRQAAMQPLRGAAAAGRTQPCAAPCIAATQPPLLLLSSPDIVCHCGATTHNARHLLGPHTGWRLASAQGLLLLPTQVPPWLCPSHTAAYTCMCPTPPMNVPELPTPPAAAGDPQRQGAATCHYD